LANEIELRQRVLLSMQRALLGEVTPDLRGVTAGWDTTRLDAIFVYDGVVTELVTEAVAVIETQVIADFFPELAVRFVAVRSPVPSDLNHFARRAWVYRRREQGPPIDGAWSRIIEIRDFHDCPRSGITTFRGQPHAFECIFSDEMDDFTDRFLLMEIDVELTQAAVERQGLFLRWRAKMRRGEVPRSYELPLVLPEDRERHQQLAAFIGDRLRPVPEKSVIVRGQMRRFGREHEDFGVRWYEVANGEPAELPNRSSAE
jgi:hypothetical protein